MIVMVECLVEEKPNNTDAQFNIDALNKVINAAIGDPSKVVLLGHSLSGLLSAAYSLEHPVRGLILLDSFGTSSKELVEKIIEEPKEMASWTHVMTIVGILRAASIFDPSQFYKVVPYEWKDFMIHCVNQPEYWTLDEMSLWTPLQNFLKLKTESGAKLNIPVLNIRSSKFGDRGDNIWLEMWKNETLLTGELTKMATNSVEILNSDHTFNGKHEELTKHITKYVESLKHG